MHRGGLRPIWQPCPPVRGRALPAALGSEEGNSTVIGTLQAIETAKPGDVLLFAAEGRCDINSFGSIAALCAGWHHRGCIDGATRDVDDLRSQGFPVFAKGAISKSVRKDTKIEGL